MTFDKQRPRFHNPRTPTGSHGCNTHAEEGLVIKEHPPSLFRPNLSKGITELFKPIRRLQSVTD
jgi:hypothetical protein